MYHRIRLFVILFIVLSFPEIVWSVPGVTEGTIVLGSVLPLQGRAAGLGRGMQAGLEGALVDQFIAGRRVRVLYMDDLYEPALTPLKVRKLIRKGIFAMIGNVGTPTAAAALPILKEAGIPAVGFFTGAGLLRTGDGPIINYRASYVQETAAVIGAALAAGLKPEQVCAYVQNDAYGKAGLLGVQMALQQAAAPPDLLQGLEALLAHSTSEWLVEQAGASTPLNENGPVGVYIRNRREVLPGYQSLKNWEQKSGHRCGLVVTVGTYDNIARFVHLSRTRGESWIVSAVSFTGADDFSREVRRLGDTNNIVMSQVVPLLDAKLPIVQEAQQVLGADFGFVSLEGYIVGKMMLRLLEDTPQPLTREGFLEQARRSHFDLGGVDIDFTRNGNQGSDLVVISQVTDAGYQIIDTAGWNEMISWHPSENNSKEKAPTSGKDTKGVSRVSRSRKRRSRHRR